MAGATVPAKTAARYLELGVFDRHLRQMRRHYKESTRLLSSPRHSTSTQKY